MEIIKELNLNKTPNTVKDYSLVGAKNVMIDPTGSFITSEDGFSVMFKCSSRIDEKIVGVIPCNEEIVVFTYSKQYDDSFVYRKFDKDDNTKACRMNTKWKWQGGKIVGSFIYNYKEQLIIVVGEYDENNPKKQIPLLSWVMPDVTVNDNGEYVSGEDTYVDYKIAPDITPYQCKYSIDNGGSLLCGTYTFFIRFENYKDTYTRWFQITDDINIYDLVEKENPKLFQMLHDNHADSKELMDNLIMPKGVAYSETNKGSTNELDSNVRIYNAYKGNADSNFLVNSFKQSANLIKLYISLTKTNNDSNFSKFQIGYIYKREATVVGRILNSYDINYNATNIVVVSDNIYQEEEAVDEFTKQPIQFYNVKNVYFYNKRIYIANYETARELYTEYNTEMTELFKGIQFNINTENGSDMYGINGAASSNSGKVWTKGYIDISLNFVYDNTTYTYGVKDVAYTVKDRAYYLDDSAEFLKNLFNVIKTPSINGNQYAINSNPVVGTYTTGTNERNSVENDEYGYWSIQMLANVSELNTSQYETIFKNYDSSFMQTLYSNCQVYIDNDIIYVSINGTIIKIADDSTNSTDVVFIRYCELGKNESASKVEEATQVVSTKYNSWAEDITSRDQSIYKTAFDNAKDEGFITTYASYTDNPIYEDTSDNENALEQGFIDISFNYKINDTVNTYNISQVEYYVQNGIKYIKDNASFTKQIINTIKTPAITFVNDNITDARYTISTRASLTNGYCAAFELAFLKDNVSSINNYYEYSMFHTIFDGYEQYIETDLVWYIENGYLKAVCESDSSTIITITDSETSGKVIAIGNYYWNTYSTGFGYRVALNNDSWSVMLGSSDKANVFDQQTANYYPKMWISLNNEQSNKTDNDDTQDNGNSNVFNATLKNQHNRTLLPYQCYKFYIHLIRKDGSVTDGYEIDNSSISRNNIELVKTKYGVAYKIIKSISDIDKLQNIILVPNFTKLSAPNGTTDFASMFNDEYIGYFFSYEEVERKVSFVKNFKYHISRQSDCSDCGTAHEDLSTKSTLNNTEILYGEEYPAITKLINISSGDTQTVYRTSINRTSYLEKHLKTTSQISNVEGTLFVTNEVTDNIYNKTVKTLYRLTQNIYFNVAEAFNTSNYYLPGFVCEDILFYFTQPVATSVSALTMQDENNIDSTFTINRDLGWTYARVPYYCYSIKTDYVEAANSYSHINDDNETINMGIKTNRSFLTTTLQDFLEIKENYTASPNVVYTNYNEKYITTFPYTIFRSNEFGDESLTNSFSQFEVDQYRVISENKGEITNLTSIGLKFFVHTKHSLFVFDRNPVLTSTASTKIPDTFDCDYKEVTMDKIGGLDDNDQCINTTIGYVWYDSKNKYIFLYKDKAGILSKDINSFIKAASIERVAFANDKGNNRLLMSLFSSDDKLFTLSFNLLTGTFISLHDYVIMKSYDTLNINYIFSDYNAPSVMPTNSTKRYNNQLLFKYNRNSNTYKQLRYIDDDTFDKYIEYVDDKIDDAGIDRYVDVIVNADYELTKSIEAIHYILNKINSDFDLIDFKNIAEEDLGRRYSGDRMIVYNSECNTDVLDINTDNNTNVLNNYKYPYWAKGQWNFNYFRNNIGTNTVPTLSDLNSVLYGKYFVIRFIFNYDIRFKLETLTVDTNPY